MPAALPNVLCRFRWLGARHHQASASLRTGNHIIAVVFCDSKLLNILHAMAEIIQISLRR